MDLNKIKEQALNELKEEEFREAVEKMKFKLKNKKNIWDKIFPYRLIIVRKEGR